MLKLAGKQNFGISLTLMAFEQRYLNINNSNNFERYILYNVFEQYLCFVRKAMKK